MAEIYAISDDLLIPENLALRYTREILECGVNFFQFRSKKAVKNERLASEILNLCEKFGAKFIVNDDVKFAKKIGANAVHLGKEDDGIKEAFEILGKDAYVGVSCYNDINLAINAAKNGASYVAFGSVFTSPTKPNAPKCGLEVVKKAPEILELTDDDNFSFFEDCERVGFEEFDLTYASYSEMIRRYRISDMVETNGMIEKTKIFFEATTPNEIMDKEPMMLDIIIKGLLIKRINQLKML